MKIKLNLDNQGDWRLYRTEEDWNSDRRSDYWRRTGWKWGTYQTTARTEPDKFPCIGIFLGTIYQAGSYDEENIAWLYDFEELLEDE